MENSTRVRSFFPIGLLQLKEFGIYNLAFQLEITVFLPGLAQSLGRGCRCVSRHTLLLTATAVLPLEVALRGIVAT